MSVAVDVVLHAKAFVQSSELFDTLKVQLTPNLFFRLFKFPYFSDRHCEKIIVLAFFVNFLWIF